MSKFEKQFSPWNRGRTGVGRVCPQRRKQPSPSMIEAEATYESIFEPGGSEASSDEGMKKNLGVQEIGAYIYSNKCRRGGEHEAASKKKDASRRKVGPRLRRGSSSFAV